MERVMYTFRTLVSNRQILSIEDTHNTTLKARNMKWDSDQEKNVFLYKLRVKHITVQAVTENEVDWENISSRTSEVGL